MTSAELKTLREACGLSQSWLASTSGVNERTVRYWESGRNLVPDDVATLIVDLDAMLDAAASAALDRALIATHDKPKAIDLYRYRSDAELWAEWPDMKGLPTTFHAVLMFRTRKRMTEAGFTVAIHWI